MNRSPEPDEYCRKLLMSVGFYVFNGAYRKFDIYFILNKFLYKKFISACECDETGSTSMECKPIGGQCQCKQNVAERTCNRCHVGYFGFGPDGCKGIKDLKILNIINLFMNFSLKTFSL